MKFTSTGVELSIDGMGGVHPYPCADQRQSGVRVQFENAPDVVLSEEVLVRALGILLHDARRQKIECVAERIMSCLK